MQPTKKLYRSDDDRIIAGVAGGLGKYFNVDSLFIRLIFLLLALVHGLGILFYVIFALVVPKEDGEAVVNRKAAKKMKKFAGKTEEKVKEMADKIEKGGKSWLQGGKRILGLVILIVGLLALLNVILPVSWFRWDIFWRAALIVVGLYLLIKTEKKTGPTPSEPAEQQK